MANSYPEYSEIIKISKILSDEREEYLKKLRDKPEYVLLDELYKKLPSCYNKFASSILNTPLAIRKPISPDTAGIIGTVIGGAAVGIVSALNAKEKEEQYRQNAKKVIQSQIETGSAYEQLYKCCSCIVDILNKYENTKNDWEMVKCLYGIQNTNKQIKNIPQKQVGKSGLWILLLLFGALLLLCTFIYLFFSL